MVAEHARRAGVQLIRKFRQIGVCFIDVEKLCEHAVLVIGKLPARKHAAGVHRKTALRRLAAPVWRDGSDDHAVAGGKIAHEASNLHDLSHRLMSQNHILALAERALPDGMNIARTGRYGNGADDRIQRAADGARFFDPSCLPHAEHGKTLHSSLLFLKR